MSVGAGVGVAVGGRGVAVAVGVGEEVGVRVEVAADPAVSSAGGETTRLNARKARPPMQTIATPRKKYGRRPAQKALRDGSPACGASSIS